MTQQATGRKGRNVVPFPARPSSGDEAARLNTALIRECVIFAQSVAANAAGFKADPNGDSDNAAKLGDRHRARADQALAKISLIPATTADGLQAKARIVPVIIGAADNWIDEREEAFLLSFART